MTRRDASIRPAAPPPRRARCSRRRSPRPAAGRRRRRSRASTSTPFARAFSRVASTAGSSMSTPSDRVEAEPRGGDREDARAAADVEQGAGRRPPGATRRQSRVVGMRARPEGAAGIDRRPRARPAAVSPTAGRPRAADPDRLMELAPAVLPAGLDVVAARTAEERARGALRRRRRCRPPARPACRRSTSSKPSGESSRMVARASSAAPGRPRRRLGAGRSAERALQLVEEALVVAVGLVVAQPLELLEQAALLVGEAARDR